MGWTVIGGFEQMSKIYYIYNLHLKYIKSDSGSKKMTPGGKLRTDWEKQRSKTDKLRNYCCIAGD